MRRSPRHKSQDRILGTTKVYCMSNWPKFWVSKFGITDNTKARVRNVSETTFGTAYHIIPPFTLAWGHACEGFVHALYFIINAPFRKGSGRTEWFLNLNPVTCLALWAIIGDSVLPYWWVATLPSPVIWLDGLFWLLVFSGLRLVLFVAMLMAACYTIIQI